MYIRTTRTYSLGMFLLGFLLICSVSALGQAPASGGIANGEKARIRGVVVHSEQGSMTVRDPGGAETVVLISSDTRMRPRSNSPCDRVCPGRCVRVEGRGNCDGHLVAEEIKFRRDDCNVCFFSENIEALKEQTGQLTQQQQALAAQQQAMTSRIEENTATARTARAEAQAAQQAADLANAGVRAAGERISALDQFEPKEEAVVTFATSSAVLRPDDKAVLDAFAAKALATKGYIITISGFTDSTGPEHFNNKLSDWRANAVMRYLVTVGNVPVQRIRVTFPGGETMPVGSNKTRHGRAQNRRAVVKLLVSPALAGETLTTTDH